MKKYNAFFYLIFMYVVFTGECVFYHYMTGKINEGADISLLLTRNVMELVSYVVMLLLFLCLCNASRTLNILRIFLELPGIVVGLTGILMFLVPVKTNFLTLHTYKCAYLGAL